MVCVCEKAVGFFCVERIFTVLL